MIDIDLVYGIDVSPWQRKVDWRRVKAAGVEFVWVKASEGQGWESPQLCDHVHGAAHVGLMVGTYHYAREGISAPVEAAQWHHECTSVMPLSLRDVSDAEWDKDEAKLTGRELVTWQLAFLRELQRLTSEAGIIYASPSYVDNVLGAEATSLGSWPWLVAAYPWDKPDWEAVRAQRGFNTERTRIARDMLSKRHRSLCPFAWQWTGQGVVDGIDGTVDRIVTTRGNLAALMRQRPSYDVDIERARRVLPEWRTVNNASEFVRSLADGPDLST